MNDFTGLTDKQEIHPWLEELISKVQLPPEFERRCRTASQAGYAIDRMRRERAYHRISDLPFDRYVRGLAELAGVELKEVQESLGVDAFDRVTATTAPALARLARLIDLSSAETERLLRWTFLGGVAPEHSASILTMHRGDPAHLSLDDALHQREIEYGEDLQAELRKVIRAVRNEYGQEV